MQPKHKFTYPVIAALAMFLQAASLPIGGPSVGKNYGNRVSMAEAHPVSLAYPLDALQCKLKSAADQPKLRTGIFVLDPANGRFADVNGQEAYAAASMIKLPILISLLQAIDRKEIRTDQMLSIREDLITGGSGSLQWRPVNSKISVKDAAELMIVLSDNTATNMIIDFLGGKENLNKDFAAWGLKDTCIRNMLGDFAGTNTTSPFDLVCLLARVERGELISPASKKWMMEIMKRTHVRTLLPPGLGPGAVIAHKTGDISKMVGDAGIVYMPDGSRYIVAVQVERSANDRRANALIRTLSRGIYSYFATD